MKRWVQEKWSQQTKFEEGLSKEMGRFLEWSCYLSKKPFVVADQRCLVT
jgi:hypothetical protein